MDSDKFICVRDSGSGASDASGSSGPQLVIVDISNPDRPIKRQISADSVIMSPVSTPTNKIIALRAKANGVTTAQIFNLDTKSKLKEWKSQEDIVYWKWISDSKMVIVTTQKVYHWSLSTPSEPVLMFERHSSLFNTQIINYNVSPDEKWICLVGLGSEGGRVVGQMQLYSVEKNISQPIEGHASTFCHFKIEGNAEPSQLFCFATNSVNGGGKLHIIEPQKNDRNRNVFAKKANEIFFPPEFATDFPLSIQASDKYGVLYVITKAGYLHVYDIESATCLYVNRITSANDSLFISVKYGNDGLIGVGREGIVLSVKLNVDTIVNYIQNTLNQQQLAVAFASRNNLLTPESGTMFTTKFNSLLSQGQFIEAARLAAKSPGGILRTVETIRKLQNVPLTGGDSASPVLTYFQALLETDKLNAIESLEISKPILRSGKFQFIEKWLKEDKIESTEELGDEIKSFNNTNLALSVYLRANCASKVVQCFAESGQFDKIVLYAKKVGFQPNYPAILRQVIRTDPDKALQLAQMVISEQTSMIQETSSQSNGMTVDLGLIAEVFIEANCIIQATSFLIDALQHDRQDDAELQTKLLEINLSTNPQVADAIFSKNMFHHYNRNYIATLCENSGLFQRALENYEDIYDIKRAMVHTSSINPDWLVQYFGTLSVENSFDCIDTLLENNAKINLQVVIKIAQAYFAQLGLTRLLELFDRYNSNEGVFFLLGAAIATSEDPEIHFRYIESAVKLGQMKEVERVIKESNFYNPERVKNYLKEQKLSDQLPLIIVCDRFNYVHDLVLYLFRNHLQKYIEIYVQKVNPSRLPEIVGGLLDVDCSEEIIKSLIMSVSVTTSSGGSAMPFSISDLSDEMEKRNALKTLLPWLELQANNGNEHRDVYNTLAKIYIESGYNAERYLRENPLYDSRVVGAYCEKRDPQLACVSYERGLCDDDMIRVCHEYSLYKVLARYLVKRRDMDLWLSVIKNKSFASINEHNADEEEEEDKSPLRSLLDQVVQTALPETNDPEDITIAVKAFMTADMPGVLIELLEKIILDKNSVFSDNRNLQNLLILTSIKSNSSKIVDYISALDNYDAPEISKIAIENNMFEEAFIIMNKAHFYKESLLILLENMKDINRAVAYVDKITQLSTSEDAANSDSALTIKSKKQMFSTLAQAQLKQNLLKDAISSYIKAEDCSNFRQIIDYTKGITGDCDKYHPDLIQYLRLAYDIQNSKEPLIEYNLLYFLAEQSIALNSTKPDLSTFADLLEHKIREKKPMYCDLLKLGDLFYFEKKYAFAKLCYSHLNHYSKLASTLVYLEEYQNAVDCAKKANTTLTWKEVCLSCLAKKEYKLAQTCAMNIITHPDELANIIKVYLSQDLITHLITMLELTLSTSATVNNNICTELAILYIDYSYITETDSNVSANNSTPGITKLMSHLQKYWSKLNIPKVIRASEKNHCWKEMVFLYTHYDEHDNAIRIMMKHPGVSFDHSIFKDSILKVTNNDLYYKSLEFYLQSYPNFFSDILLNCLSQRLEPNRVIKLFQTGYKTINGVSTSMDLIREYLFSVQNNNNMMVNECIHKMLIEEEDAESLKLAVLNPDYDNFDQVKLAEQLETHASCDLRKLAARLYHMNKKWDKAVMLSKTDNLYDEAIRFAYESKDIKQIYELLEFFLKEKDQLNLFSTCLYQCYDLLKPDVVMELAWRYKQMDAAMPFFIQSMRDVTTKVDFLMKENQELKREVKKNDEETKKQITNSSAMGFNMMNGIVGNGNMPSNMMVPVGNSNAYMAHSHNPYSK